MDGETPFDGETQGPWRVLLGVNAIGPNVSGENFQNDLEGQFGFDYAGHITQGYQRANGGAQVPAGFDFIFFLSAGQDESATWQEFGMMKFPTKEDVPDVFRARYAGKFREFTYQGRLDPAWVPFAFKTPSHLPPGMHLKSVMVFDPRFCGSLGLVYSDGVRNLYIFQQPEDKPIALSGLKTTTNEVCKYNATHCQVGEYRVITWTHEKTRFVLLSNLDLPEIETSLASLR